MEEDKLIAFVDGFVTDEADLTDEMYEKAAMHNEDGAWQMIFGVNTLPDYRKHGYAGQLIQCAIKDAREQGRKGLVLTCKEKPDQVLCKILVLLMKACPINPHTETLCGIRCG